MIHRPSKWDSRVEELCSEWEGTPYRLNRCRPGIGVDCIHFAAAVLDGLYGSEHSKDLKSLPPDACVHNRKGVMAAARSLFSKYPEVRRVDGAYLEAGDLVCLGRDHTLNTTQHLMVVGGFGRLWHASHPRVHYTGTALPPHLKLVCVYRASDKEEKWPC